MKFQIHSFLWVLDNLKKGKVLYHMQKPKLRVEPKLKPNMKPKIQTQPLTSTRRTYFKEIEHRGVTKLVNMIDLSPDMVCHSSSHESVLEYGTDLSPGVRSETKSFNNGEGAGKIAHVQHMTRCFMHRKDSQVNRWSYGHLDQIGQWFTGHHSM